MSPRRCLTLLGCMLGLAITASARKPGEPLKPGWNVFSKTQDIQIGQAAAQEVRQKYQEVRNPFLQAYLRRIGDRLAAAPEARLSGFQFTFTLLVDPSVNAFALPGGPMFVFTGLLNSTENEGQLAAAMAHEMSHVILRHGTHEATKANSVKLLANMAAAAAGATGGVGAGQLANIGLGVGANSFILHFSREAESEADALGSHMMAEAGYNPIEMARFFEKLAATGDQGPQFLSDHPNPGNRQHAIEQEIRTLPQREYGYETGDFARAKIALRSPNAVSGPLSSGMSLKVTDWKQVHAPSFTVAFPANWGVYKEGDEALIIAPQDGLVKDAKGSTHIAFGAAFRRYMPPSAQMSLGTATLSLVGYLHDLDPSLQLSNTPQKNVTVNGSEGILTLLESNSVLGGAETDLVVTVNRPQGLFYVLFAAPQQRVAEFQGTFEQMVSSLQFTN